MKNKLIARRKSTIRQAPTMPENCCGNGCRNCVWDAYFQELEEYNKLYSDDKLSAEHKSPEGDSTSLSSEINSENISNNISKSYETTGEKRHQVDELDNPILTIMNDNRQHDESHLEKAKIHYLSKEDAETSKLEANETDKVDKKSGDKDNSETIGSEERKWLKYMGYLHPKKETDPYLHSLYYQYTHKDKSGD